MTAKNNFKKQRKDNQRRKARAVKNAKVNHVNRSKPKSKRRHPEYSDEFVNKYIAEHGIARAVIDLKLKAEDQEFTNKDVSRMIAESIPPLMRTHAGVEIAERLFNEKTLTLSAQEIELVVNYDKAMVRFTENVDAALVMIEADRQPSDYMVIIEDLTYGLMDLMTDLRDKVVELMETHRDAIEEYAKEHRGEDEDMDKYMEKLHTQRMATIFPLYKTQNVEVTKEVPFDEQQADDVELNIGRGLTEPVFTLDQPSETQPAQ